MRISAFFIICYILFVSFSLQALSDLQPHRAYYKVKMESRADPRTPLIDVRGTMMLEINKVCEGWTIQQLSELWRYYDDASIEHVRWGYVTWETEDGSLFKFNTYRKADEELTEDIRGSARKQGNAIEATYQKPTVKTMPLPPGTLFPVQHTKKLLKAAEEGEHIFSQIVFDGSTEEGTSEINTFIGSKKILAGNPGVEGTHQFAHQPFWPVRFAVYGMGGTDYEPDYVTTQDLLSNGIIKQYTVDDGIVKIHGMLERVELLSESGC